MEKKEVKSISVKEFREKGYLQELNRLFLHPLGLALEIIILENGEEQFGKIWDSRNDPEGILFGEDIVGSSEAKEKSKNIAKEFKRILDYREKIMGFRIQKIKSIKNKNNK